MTVPIDPVDGSTMASPDDVAAVLARRSGARLADDPAPAVSPA